MRWLAIAIQFLTIVSVPSASGFATPKDMARSAAFFPLVGAFQGLLFFTAFPLLKIFPADIVGAFIIAMLIISNAGFHVDGLSDTFDALSVKSTGDRQKDIERRLSVMKDSTTGAIGVVGVVITILMKYLFVSHILGSYPIVIASSVLFLMPMLSKWSMLFAMFHGNPARQDGIGQIFINNIRLNTLFQASILMSLIYLTVSGLINASVLNLIGFFFIFSGMLYVFSLLSVRFFKKKFGGLTGDTLGAIHEGSEIIFLMGASIWLQHFIS